MAKLDSDVRPAFERRLAAVPHSPDLRARVSAKIEMGRPRFRAWQAMALSAGILLVGAVTFSFLITRHWQPVPAVTIVTPMPTLATHSPLPSPTSGAPSPTPRVHATGDAQFAGCYMTTRKDSFGNPLWYCPRAPYGYHYWEPPADCCGDWVAIEP